MTRYRSERGCRLRAGRGVARHEPPPAGVRARNQQTVEQYAAAMRPANGSLTTAMPSTSGRRHHCERAVIG